MGTKKDNNPTRRERLFQNAVVAVISTIFSLAAFWPLYYRLREKILRHKALEAGDSIEKELESGNIRRNQYGDPRIPFLGAPNRTVMWYGTVYHFNNWGFRSDHDYNADKMKRRGEVRIAFLGDSVMFGGLLPHYEETIPAMVRELLSPDKANIFNFSMLGFNTAAEQGVFDEFVKKRRLDIDICIWQFLNNDDQYIWGQKGNDPWFSEIARKKAWSKGKAKIFYLSYLKRVLNEVKQTSVKSGIKFFFMPSYSFNEFLSGRRDSFTVEAASIARSLGIHAIDVFDDFVRLINIYGRPKNRYMKKMFDIESNNVCYVASTIWDNIHFNARGNAVIARRIVMEIAPYLPVKGGCFDMAIKMQSLPAF